MGMIWGGEHGANLKIWRKWPSLWDKTELRYFKSLNQPKAGPSPALPLPVPGVKICHSLSSTLGRSDTIHPMSFTDVSLS